MKGKKLINLISATILLFCCGSSFLLFSQTAEPEDNEQNTTTLERDSESARESSPVPSATQTPNPQIEVNVSSANIRSGPGTNYPSIQFAFEGDVFDVIASNNSKDWFIILLNGSDHGWIAASVVTNPDSFENIQVAATIPAPPVEQPVRSNQITIATNTPEPTSAAVCNCSGDTYNCGNFSRSSQAQACFNYCISQGRGDIHRLDRDNDGRVCESLP